MAASALCLSCLLFIPYLWSMCACRYIWDKFMYTHIYFLLSWITYKIILLKNHIWYIWFFSYSSSSRHTTGKTDMSATLFPITEKCSCTSTVYSAYWYSGSGCLVTAYRCYVVKNSTIATSETRRRSDNYEGPWETYECVELTKTGRSCPWLQLRNMQRDRDSVWMLLVGFFSMTRLLFELLR